MSRAPENILAQVSSSNANEIVITGIDLSAFGKDIGMTLPSLLAQISHPRVRFGSLEPSIITDEFLQAVAPDRFCKHFHLSMQSGSDSVLRAMNRHYTSQIFLEKVALIRSYFPNANITTDIIAGFPTETLQAHEETLRTVAQAKFGDAHVFPYSEREGTRAAKMEQIPKAERSRRAKEIAELCERTRNEFLQAQIEKKHFVLTEQTEGDYVTGYTQNYVKVYLPKETPCNRIIEITPVALFADGVR